MYVTFLRVGGAGLGLGLVGSGVLSCWGVGVLVFGGEGGGGGGKDRVSGWPFRNEEERRAKREKRGKKI